MSTSTHAAVVDTYLAMWNESDPDARRDLIESAMTADARYVDPMADVTGTEAMGQLISAVQEQFPGHRFELHTAPDAHHDCFRFRWALVADGGDGEPVAIGLDIATLSADGRLSSVIGFLDPVS